VVHGMGFPALRILFICSLVGFATKATSEELNVRLLKRYTKFESIILPTKHGNGAETPRISFAVVLVHL
jgi:hypothetical protein